MLKKISDENFYSEIVMEKSPILFAYIYKHANLSEQMESLEGLSPSKKIKICYMTDQGNNVCEKLKITGSPVFIAFKKGKEKGRMIGMVDSQGLNNFVSNSL